jgi:hypothetical protein
MSSGNTTCSLSIYIQNNIKNFDELLKNVCRSRLSSSRSNNGLTFIIPDSSMVDKYIELSRKPTSQNDLKMMQSFCERHFLLGNVKDYKGSSIINGENKHLNIDGLKLSDGKHTVELKEAGVSFPIKTIKGKESTPNVSIYKQVNSSDGVHKLQGSDTPTKSLTVNVKKGGALYTKNDIIKNVIYMYNLNQIVHNNDKSKHFLNPFLAAVNSLMLLLRKHHNTLYKNILMIKDVSPEVNFFILMKTFGSNKECLISNEIITKWGGTLFDYKPKTLDRIFDLEAHEILSSNQDLVNAQENPDTFYDMLSKVTELSTETHKAIDKFRSTYRQQLMNMCSAPIPSEALKNICADMQLDTSTIINTRIMGGMEATGSLCYLNNLMVYDNASGSVVSVNNKAELPHISHDDTCGDHFMLGFEMLNKH